MRTVLAWAMAAMLLGAGATAQTVTVYTDRTVRGLVPILQAFQQETGINVQLRTFKEDVLDRLLDEDDQSEADIYITASIGNLDEAYRAGLTQPITSPALDARVPARFRQEDNHWYGVTLRTRNLYIRTQRSNDRSRITYDDLATPRFAGQICIRSGKHAYNIDLIAAYIVHYGREAARDWLIGMRENLARVPQGNDRAQMKAVADGICSIAIGNSYYYGLAHSNLRQREWAEQIQLVFPSFPNDGTHVNLSGMAMLTTADNVDAARRFMEFQVGEIAQGIYNRELHEFPINSDLGSAQIYGMPVNFVPDSISIQQISNAQRAARQLVDEVQFNDGPQGS
ncbi:iron(III) transport system substrate-binding protein [Rubricella aquisinus]|uniref:Iron(III) transport system substrate-binding protein n=1 Tax=Rubricella aquisinus TaxID=2028108 RepID=A0A840WNL7_9RHOB|nr:extracellular solute-binding protein [Rubricella aquisinus]MBB5515683.1 iron(III) transport system substrate-binding protein [Rubricella aquisinus]